MDTKMKNANYKDAFKNLSDEWTMDTKIKNANSSELGGGGGGILL